MAFVVAGFEPASIVAPNMEAWLQAQASAGSMVGGISNGAFVLAHAGLLDGCAATVHWEDFPSFCALHPQVRPRYQRYLIDRNRLSCSGGTSTLDLFVEIVREDLGNDLSLQVSRQMLLHDYSNPGGLATESILDGSQHFSFRVQRALSLIDPGDRATHECDATCGTGRTEPPPAIAAFSARNRQNPGGDPGPAAT